MTITLAETWEQVEQYAAASATCIGPSRTNWADAKKSWEQDKPQPIYVLLDHRGRKGYVRFLPVAGFLWSDFFTMADHLIKDNAKYHTDIWLEAMRFLGQPCLLNHNSYGGRAIKWLGPTLSYKRVNSYPYNGASIWVLYPEDIGGQSKDLHPSPQASYIDC